jgi:GMP synthase-like glutamine amidotransferase
MPRPIAIFRHVDCEGPGYLTQVLDRHGLAYQLLRIDANDPLPDDPGDFSALVFMGGSMSVNDDLPWIAREVDLIQQAIAAKMPILGHCLGGQLISKAMGGVVSANPLREIGWLPVNKVDSAIADQWLGSDADAFLAFHWHGETFSLPPGTTHILQSKHCAHQGFVKDNILALQCHIEMTSELVREWVSRFSAQLSPETETVQGPATILDDLENKISAMQGMADVVYRHWLDKIQQ